MALSAPSCGWQGEPNRTQELCAMFEAAGSANTQIQQQVVQALNQFRQLPDLNMYLVGIFAQMPSQPEAVRQRAGLLLKTNVEALQRSSVAKEIAEHINSQTLQMMKDSSRAIRHTAGTVLTTMVQKLGPAACSTTLEKLVEFLRDPSHSVVEGTLSAVGKICEDGCGLLGRVSASRRLKKTGPALEVAMQDSQLFVTWASQHAVPRMFDCASPSAPDFAKQSALECLNHFALGEAFGKDARFPTLDQHCPRYIEVLGTLANDTNTEVLTEVCKGFACIVENEWKCLTDHHYNIILQFMLKASQHPEYNVRIEALAVWISCAKTPDSWAVIRAMLPDLVPVLVTNIAYTDADYMILETSQVENDNADVPDNLEDIKPRFHKESNNIDGDEDDEGLAQAQTTSGHGWGAEWTARKAAARSLDDISGVFQAEVVQAVLPIIQAELQHASWERQEMGVLALGAIAVNCVDKLAQFLPKVLELLVGLCSSDKPLLRSMACWCLSRFAGWICSENNAHREQILPVVLKVILPRCLDRNKRVQEASISAIMTFEEYGRAQMIPYTNDLVETFAQAFPLYKTRSHQILLETVGFLVWAVGEELNKPQYVEKLVTPIIHMFDAVQDTDLLTLPLFECLSTLAQALGNSLVSVVPRLVMRCIRIVNDTAAASQMWAQNPNEYEKPDKELMAASCDLLSSILEGFKEHSREIVAKFNFLSIVPMACRESNHRVKQSGFWLMGTCGTHCVEPLVPLLPELLPLCVAGLGLTASMTVNTNAAWALGEVTKIIPDEVVLQQINPHLATLIPALVAILCRREGQEVQAWQRQGHGALLQNVCMTLGIFKQRTALGSQWSTVVAQIPEDLRAKYQVLFAVYGLVQ